MAGTVVHANNKHSSSAVAGFVAGFLRKVIVREAARHGPIYTKLPPSAEGFGRKKVMTRRCLSHAPVVHGRVTLHVRIYVDTDVPEGVRITIGRRVVLFPYFRPIFVPFPSCFTCLSRPFFCVCRLFFMCLFSSFFRTLLSCCHLSPFVSVVSSLSISLALPFSLHPSVFVASRRAAAPRRRAVAAQEGVHRLHVHAVDEGRRAAEGPGHGPGAPHALPQGQEGHHEVVPPHRCADPGRGRAIGGRFCDSRGLWVLLCTLPVPARKRLVFKRGMLGFWTTQTYERAGAMLRDDFLLLLRIVYKTE